MSPPVAPTTDHRRQHERRGQGQTETLIRYAHSVLDSIGVDRSPAWVSRAVRDYGRRGVGRCTFGTWLTDRLGLTAHQRERSEIKYLLAYADPTGEVAVRRVMRGQRS